VSTAAYDPIFFGLHCFVDYQLYIWQIQHPDAEYPDEAVGSLRDSIGTFLGSDIIADQSRWARGRSPSDLRTLRQPNSIGPLSSEPLLFLIVRQVLAPDLPIDLSVFVDDVEIATEVRFGMKGMPKSIFKNVTLLVEPDSANNLWLTKNVALESIPSLGRVFHTKEGIKVEEVPYVTIDMVWKSI
jgi:hypothetical protein